MTDDERADAFFEQERLTSIHHARKAWDDMLPPDQALDACASEHRDNVLKLIANVRADERAKCVAITKKVDSPEYARLIYRNAVSEAKRAYEMCKRVGLDPEAEYAAAVDVVECATETKVQR
jgi:hypothetical protein